MTIFSGSTETKRIFVGGTEVHRVYSGSDFVWPDFYSVLTVGTDDSEWGFLVSHYGSMSDTSFFGTTITGLRFDPAKDDVILSVSSFAEGMFDRIVIGNTEFIEASATYSGSSASWIWRGVANPFGTTVSDTRIIKAIEG